MFGESTYGVLPNPIYKEVGKIAKQCGNKISFVRKRQSVSLGVVYESPQKVELNESCKEFESQLNEIKNSFKKVQQIKPNLSEVEMSGKQIEKSNKNISKSSCKNNETVKDFNIMSPVLFNMVCFEVDFTNVSRLFCFKTTELTGDLSIVTLCLLLFSIIGENLSIFTEFTSSSLSLSLKLVKESTK
jgi:seryl-tRNA synthetase